jgi:DMSO/TMAO reductase YedYZ molybdopterin-dependent catalytic subunit
MAARTPPIDESAPARDPRGEPVSDAPSTRTNTALLGAVAGLVAGGVAVTVGMLVAGLIGVISPIDGVGSAFIDRTPLWLKQRAIEWFGTNDKLALRVGITVILAVISVVLGMIATRQRIVGIAGISAFGVVGAAAASSRPAEPNAAIWPSLIGAACGVALLWYLLELLGTTAQRVEMPHESRAPLGVDRRRFLVTSGAAAAAAVVAGSWARALENQRIHEIKESIPDALPSVETPVTIPAGAEVVSSTPFITPTKDFYRVDTALSFPRVDIDRWKVDIAGMVDRPISLSYHDLLSRPQVERVITLTCVSNDVGGPYIGNATWQGVLLADLLREAGVHADAEQVFGTSLDGFTCGFPASLALDGRDAMIATGMNGQPLPLEHGFPARVVVPGLYGYVSATKWLRKLELTTWDNHVGYWVPRGWAREAPIKTESRIDVPRQHQTLSSGRTNIAGVAWAQHRGIAKVEVRVDGGEWMEATLGTDVSDDSWRQWTLVWDAPAGDHEIEVRATDKTGETQTERVAPPAPDGATGYHRRAVSVV